ncbi:MAG: Stp1/IreP family PP2C-type Ser/Thr phosphatase [Pseudomonadota bacterium]
MNTPRNSVVLDACGVTDVGCVRQNNEDAFLVRSDLPLFLVADGVGGAAAGEIASRLFCESCAHEFASFLEWSTDYSALLRRSFTNANRAILEYTRDHPETKGMACTAEVLTFVGNDYYLGHVGDSRAYLIRNRQITQITKDHSFVQEQLDLGLIDQEEAKTHWLRNAIYKAVGQTEDLDIDIVTGRVMSGDLFLLCSDGLSDMLDNGNILKILATPIGLDMRVQSLIDEAKRNGGRDNVTAVVCEIDKITLSQGLTGLAKRLIGVTN